ncbi:hypothetical protein CANMA_000547 [Candida margitis]|uniref:uncharacterized protein n=1 Tax=Candida margitis TaxID=1775924 RepID=UPI002226885F|nr:uncharacterized protein CANMA_000547 [Candida margitis]KAI5970384.1 hypothetical protein CANMA_000547 [Candida margitis]
MDDLSNQVTKKSPQLHVEIGALIADLRRALALSEIDKCIIYRSVTTKLVAIINEFELQPKLLEKQLASYVNELSSLFIEDVSIGEFIGNVVYALAKVCTFKTTALFFSSDVYLLDSLIDRCRDSSEAVKFVCLLWLCNLVLVPFPIKTVGAGLRERLAETAKISLRRFVNLSKTQVVASILYSRLLSRPDCQDMLHLFLEQMVNSWSSADASQKLGTFLTVNKLLKRVELSPLEITGLYSCIMGDILESKNSNMSLVYSIKILSKLAVNYIKRAQFQGVAEVINNLINDILLSDITFETNLRYAIAKAMSTIVEQLSFTAVNYQNQLIRFIPDLIDREETNVPKLHTILLSLGYISLSKNLPAMYEMDCIALASRCLFFKVPKGTVLIGSQIRDSACFLIWSVVRNMKHSSSNLVNTFVDLLKVLVFDELLLKKCSVAVMQEILGRLGKELVNTTYKGEFIVNFVSKLDSLRLDQHICYQFIDSFYGDIDLSFLIWPLVEMICNDDVDGGHYLNKLLKQPVTLELVPKCTTDFNQIVSKLKQAHKWHILFQLDEFQEGHHAFDNFVFDESKLDMIKGYLFALKYKQLNGLDWQNLLKISQHSNLVEEMRQVVAVQEDLPIEDVLYHLPHDRNLSCTLFNFPNLEQHQYDRFVNVIKDFRVDVVVRANLIDNLAANIPPFFKVHDIYTLFDDYTTTDQGDVGSRIRIAAIKLVVKNNFVDNTVRLKMARLSGELMDKIRHLSFKALTGKDFTWSHLFSYYQSMEVYQFKVEFWRGVAFTCGSFIGNTKIINESFVELLRHGPKAEDFEIWLTFLKQPDVRNKREVKLVSMVLQMILKLFDSNYQIKHDLNYQDLFVKCYNLHINTKNLTRVMTVLQILLHISQRCTKLRPRIYDRFLWILKNHPSAELRAFVSENILFEVVGEASFQRYEKINWFDIKQSDLSFIEGVLQSID